MPHLVVTRKDGESVVITHPDQSRTVVTVAQKDNKTRVRVDAPDNVLVNRKEIQDQIDARLNTTNPGDLPNGHPAHP